MYIHKQQIKMLHCNFHPLLSFPIYFYFYFYFCLHHHHTTSTVNAAIGTRQWRLLQPSIGISAMHMQLLSSDRVIMFDRTDFGPSNLSLPAGHPCRHDPFDQALTTDCTAHSADFDPINNSLRPLTVQTDTFCSSGSVLPNGLLVQTGGYNDGDHVIRTFDPYCGSPYCDWVELQNKLLVPRWYATNHILPDGRTIIIGGRKTFNYEFYPKTTSFGGDKLFNLGFLVETNERRVENNLYPFVFLHVDGNLFIFANNRAILFDYNKNLVVRTYPVIPGGDPRNYPSTGSGVLLPLNLPNLDPEVFICGGAPIGSFRKANRGEFVPALNTCARMKISDPNPTWAIETMPMARTMGDMILLPDGNVLIINGAGSGTAGWELGRDPVLSPVIYCPDCKPKSRFEVQISTKTPRMYHSTAILLRDGRVLVGGSNPHTYYNFTNVLYPTELSLEAFLPPYLNEARPGIMALDPGSKIKYGKVLRIKFSITGSINPVSIKITMIRPPFTTHSFSMNQRMLVLTNAKPVMKVGPNVYEVTVITPESANIAPPGFYMLFVVHHNIPSEGMWVQL